MSKPFGIEFAELKVRHDVVGKRDRAVFEVMANLAIAHERVSVDAR